MANHRRIKRFGFILLFPVPTGTLSQPVKSQNFDRDSVNGFSQARAVRRVPRENFNPLRIGELRFQDILIGALFTSDGLLWSIEEAAGWRVVGPRQRHRKRSWSDLETLWRSTQMPPSG